MSDQPRAHYVVAFHQPDTRSWHDWRRYRKRTLALARAKELSATMGRVVVWNERRRGVYPTLTRDATATFHDGRCIYDDKGER